MSATDRTLRRIVVLRLEEVVRAEDSRVCSLSTLPDLALLPAFIELSASGLVAELSEVRPSLRIGRTSPWRKSEPNTLTAYSLSSISLMA